jgi:hypothetical protein
MHGTEPDLAPQITASIFLIKQIKWPIRVSFNWVSVKKSQAIDLEGILPW